MYHGSEDVIFGLLLTRQLIEWNDAGVRLGFRVFHIPVNPSFGYFVSHPSFVAHFWADVLLTMQQHSKSGAIFLPLRGVFPCGLAHIAKRLTVGAIDFMTDAGDFLVCHHALLPANLVRSS